MQFSHSSCGNSCSGAPLSIFVLFYISANMFCFLPPCIKSISPSWIPNSHQNYDILLLSSIVLHNMYFSFPSDIKICVPRLVNIFKHTLRWMNSMVHSKTTAQLLCDITHLYAWVSYHSDPDFKPRFILASLYFFFRPTWMSNKWG